MAGLIKANGKTLKEGEIYCKWLHNRLIRRNKNVLTAELGPTGSGKSYRDLRKAELWYKYHFKKKFPPENICFGTLQVMRRLNSKELKRGEILIFEEAGANLGSLDFQLRVSKIFTYVLQSFRSMNIGIFFNLPYLSMLNKQARMLLHCSFESAGIDFDNKINSCKPLFHQVNQITGKIYRKYLRIKVDGRTRAVKRFNFSMPSKELIKVYEKKKAQYLADVTEEYTNEMENIEFNKAIKLGRPLLTDKQKEVYDLLCLGLSQKEVAKRLGRSEQTVSSLKQAITKKGYLIRTRKPKKSKKSKGENSSPPT